MPSYIKLPSGSIRVLGQIKGKRYAKTFKTKVEAKEWWEHQETRANELSGIYTQGKTFEQALERYLAEIVPNRKGSRQEKNRILFFLENFPQFRKIELDDFTPRHATAFKNARLDSGINSSTLSKDVSLLKNVFNYCVREWFWCKENPFKNLSLPKRPLPRERLVSGSELVAMCQALGYVKDKAPETVSARVAIAMLFAVETGLRSGEICNLKWEDVWIDERTGRYYIHVTDSKTKSGIRDVPLSSRARDLVKQLQQVPNATEYVFNLTSAIRDALFRKARDKAGLGGFTFHDLRATAATRLSQKLDPRELAKVLGHRGLGQIMVYYREKIEIIAQKFD